MQNSDSLQGGGVSKSTTEIGEEIQSKIAREPVPVPMARVAPAVPITIQMGAVGDHTINLAPLPTFSGWQGSDPDHHLSQF